MVHYFAFGSNLLRSRIEARLGACDPGSIATLSHHDLRFHKRGADGSGKCDAFRTGEPDHRVHGVLYRLSEAQMEALDEYEGGYERIEVRVAVVEPSSQFQLAYTYIAEARCVQAGLLPFDWYKAMVVNGAMAHGLPPEYVQRLTDHPTRVESPPTSRLRSLGAKI